MRKDYLKQIRQCASIPCRAKIQFGHSRWYRGRYNGHPFERLREQVVARTVPMRKTHTSTWGGAIGALLSGSVFAGSGRYDRQTHVLVAGRWWARGRDDD